VEIGYTMKCEQSGPKAMVRDLQLAEAAGFDPSVISTIIRPGSTPPAITADRQIANAALPDTRRPMVVETAMQLQV